MSTGRRAVATTPKTPEARSPSLNRLRSGARRQRSRQAPAHRDGAGHFSRSTGSSTLHESKCHRHMTSMASPTEKESPDGWRYLQDLLVPVLLVVAALATSWSSYQATDGTGNRRSPPAAPAPSGSRPRGHRVWPRRRRRWISRPSRVGRCGPQWEPHAWGLLPRAVPATSSGPAYDARMATAPFTNPEAPPTPFATARIGWSRGRKRLRNSRLRCVTMICGCMVLVAALG